MLDGIKDFFNELIAPADAREADPGHALRVATAALLVETMRMDNRYADEEHATVARALEAQFGLRHDEVAELVALADAQARQATDYYQFTSLINRGFDADQKEQIIENMWRVALADGHLDAHEQHLLSKIADLLYVPHSQYIAAKLRARAALAREAKS